MYGIGYQNQCEKGWPVSCRCTIKTCCHDVQIVSFVWRLQHLSSHLAAVSKSDRHRGRGRSLKVFFHHGSAYQNPS